MKKIKGHIVASYDEESSMHSIVHGAEKIIQRVRSGKPVYVSGAFETDYPAMEAYDKPVDFDGDPLDSPHLVTKQEVKALKKYIESDIR